VTVKIGFEGILAFLQLLESTFWLLVKTLNMDGSFYESRQLRIGCVLTNGWQVFRILEKFETSVRAVYTHLQFRWTHGVINHMIKAEPF